MRLHRWRIDEARRQLAALERQAHEYEQTIAELDANLRVETRRQDDDLVALSRSAHEFIVRTLAERDRLSAAMESVTVAIDAARDALKELIWERRRLELRVEQIEKEEHRLAMRQEANALDDQANTRHVLGKLGRVG